MSRFAKKLAVAFSTAAMLASSFGVAAPAFAAAHAVGTNIKSSDGTVWMIMPGNCRRAYTSAGAFLSYGFNSWSSVVDANADDLALATCPEGFIPPQDGGIVFSDRGADQGTGYVISGGKKYGFPTEAIFFGQGYSYANATWADMSWMMMGGVVNSASDAHLPGTLVNNGGTVQLIGDSGLMGIPDLATFNSWGYSFAKVVPANDADKAKTQTGVMSARQAGQLSPTAVVSTPGSSFSASLAATNPAAGTLVVGQALADLAHFNVSGSGTITSIGLKRIGVSADTTLEDVFLFEGNTRLTDSASVSGNSMINIAGLNLSVSGSRTLSVRADIDGTAGETVGVQLVSVNGTNLASMPSGNMHTLAGATLAGVALSAATDSGDTDPGNDILVWQATAKVTTRDVVFNRLALRNIGSINNADIKDFVLMVDGVQVASASGLDSNRYVTFSGFSKTLQSGNRIIKVQANVIGGSSSTVEMSLRGAYDIGVTDSQFNVGVEAEAATFPFDDDGFTVNPGTVTVVKAADSPSGDVINNGSDVVMGRWTLTSFGEPIRVETLVVGFTYTEDTGGNGDDNDPTPTLRNGRLLINDTQYGSTTSVATTGTSFTTNYTANPGSPVTIEFRADVFDNDGEGAGFELGDDIQVSLNNTGSGFRQVSGGTVTIPTSSQNANSLNVTEGNVSLTVQSNYTSQTITVPQSAAFKLGAFNLVGDSTETINLNTITVDFNGNDEFESADLSNVYVKYGSNQSSVKSTIAPGTTDDATATWSINHSLAPNEVLSIEVYASIGNFTVAGGNDTMQTSLTVIGVAQSSGTTVYADSNTSNSTQDAGLAGQIMTAGTGGLTTAVDASSPIAALHEDNKTLTAAAFEFTAANDAFTVTDVTLTLAGTSSVNSVVVKDGGTTIATRPAAATIAISGLSVPVASNSTKVLTVELQLGTVGSGAGTSREDVKVSMSGYKANNSQGTQVTQASEAGFATRAGASQFVFAAIPTITEQAISNVDPIGTVDVAKLTVTATGGNIAVKQIGFGVTITEGDTDATLTAGTFKLFRDGSDITDQVAIVNSSGATIESTNFLGEGASTGYIVFATEEQISATRTYTLRTTLGGAWETGDSIRVNFDSDSAPGATVKYLNDADTTAGDVVVSLADSAGANETAAQNFVWSDRSAVPHAATITDDEGLNEDDAPTSSGDWTNGYLVKNLPLPAYTLTY